MLFSTISRHNIVGCTFCMVHSRAWEDSIVCDYVAITVLVFARLQDEKERMSRRRLAHHKRVYVPYEVQYTIATTELQGLGSFPGLDLFYVWERGKCHYNI